MTAALQMVRPADVPLIWDLAREQNRRCGTDIGVPRIFDDSDRPLSNIPLAIKQVIDGRLVQAHIFVCQPELLTFGENRRATALSLRELPAAMWHLEAKGYTGFHALAPVRHLAEWEKIWGNRLNLVRDDSRVAHYYRSFRGAR